MVAVFMQTKNIHFFNNWFLGIDVWLSQRGPYYVWPSLVWVSMEDLNINVKGASITFLFLHFAMQIQIKKWDTPKDDRKFQIADKNMEILLDELTRKHGWKSDPDPAKIRELIAKNAWLRMIISSVGVQNAYALNVLSGLLHERMNPINQSNELNFDLLDSKLKG